MYMIFENSKKVSVVIPAYNEERTIASVVMRALENIFVSEVIVVDDGSTDDTFLNSMAAGARIIRKNEKNGKADAMDSGVKVARNDIICFLDADLIGLKDEHITALILPVLQDKADLNIGIRQRKNYFINKIIHLCPLIGGERVLTRGLWDKIPKKYKKNFEIEIAINYHAKKFKYRTRTILINKLRQIKKEKKHGLWKGMLERIGMIRDIILISFRLYLFDQFKPRPYPATKVEYDLD